MKNCLIIGWFGYNNLGDELMLHTLLSYIGNRFSNVIVISSNPQQTEKIHSVKSISLKALLKNLRNVDVFIFGGGQIFSDRRLRTIPLWTFILYIVKLFNPHCKIFLINQGFEVNNRILYLILKFALSSANLISVRDFLSFYLIKSMNLKNNILFGPDILFSFNLNKIKNYKNIKINNKFIIGVNLRHYFWWRKPFNKDKFEHLLAKSLDLVVENLNAELVFVPFRLPGKELYDDLEFTKSVISKMINKDHVKVFVSPLDSNIFYNLLVCFKRFDFFIGTAFHSVALACSLGIPFTSFPYQKKIDLFMNALGLSDFSIKPYELYSSELIFKKIIYAFNLRKKINSIIHYKYNFLVKESKISHIMPILKFNNYYKNE